MANLCLLVVNSPLQIIRGWRSPKITSNGEQSDFSPFDVIVGDQHMEELRGVIELGNREVTFKKEEKTVILPLESESSRTKETGTGNDSEEFTSASYSAP